MNQNNTIPKRVQYISAFFILVALCSCGTSLQKILKENCVEAREPKYDCFIQWEDNTIKNYNKLVIRRPPLVFEYLEGDGVKIKEKLDDIKAYQTSKYYAERLNIQGGVKFVMGNMPFSDFFAVRVKNGKIELFLLSKLNPYNQTGSTFKTPVTPTYIYTFYLRKGKTSYMQPFSEGLLKEMVKDKKNLYENFYDYFTKSDPDKGIMNVLEEYN